MLYGVRAGLLQSHCFAVKLEAAIAVSRLVNEGKSRLEISLHSIRLSISLLCVAVVEFIRPQLGMILENFFHLLDEIGNEEVHNVVVGIVAREIGMMMRAMIAGCGNAW